MKIFKTVLIVCLTLFSFIGCKDQEEREQKENPKQSVAEEEKSFPWNDESDLSFSEGLNFMENRQNPEAAKSIQNGIVALKEEAKDATGKAKEKIDISIKQLDTLVSALKKGINVPIYKARELIANAKINTYYNYLAGDDTYVTEDPRTMEMSETQKSFTSALSNLKQGEDNVQSESKKDYDGLVLEGKKLKDEYDSWNKRTKEYNKKTNEYFKKHNPKYYMEKIGGNPSD